jgi:thymidylate synthase ThyX
MSYQARVLKDSINHLDTRLVTFEVTIPRIVLAEFNTHRQFCLAGDSELEFDLPGGSNNGKYKRVYKMRLDDFVDKWLYGARRKGFNPKRIVNIDWAESGQLYSALEVASRLGMATAFNINNMCRQGDLEAVRAENGRTWMIDGAEIKRWRNSSPDHTRFDIRARLSNMRIRQLNEDTGDIQYSYVKDATISGTKDVFEVHAGEYMVAGSADHRVLTSEGWKTIGELKPKDLLVVRKFGKKDDSKLDPLRLKKINGAWRSVWQSQKREELQSNDKLCRRCCKYLGTAIHHIVPVYQDLSRAFDEENITLLCESCHAEEHHIQDWQGGTYLYGSYAQVTQILFRGEEDTYDLEIVGPYPNFIANGVVVHNSRNSASSRALPIQKMLKMVQENPYVPEKWGRNQSGMQAYEDLLPEEAQEAEKEWLKARDLAVKQVERLLEIGVHKQTTNRLLEPFMWHTIICSATEYSNFFNLRNHHAAHPAIQKPAQLMQDLYETSEPEFVAIGSWHTPLLNIGIENEEEQIIAALNADGPKQVSIARCARVSYLTHDGQRDFYKDIELYTRLTEMGHLSPTEHVATPFDPSNHNHLDLGKHSDKAGDYNMWFGNFNNWIQYRQFIFGEADLLGHLVKE